MALVSVEEEQSIGIRDALIYLGILSAILIAMSAYSGAKRIVGGIFSRDRAKHQWNLGAP